ncbi:cryptococcal mannosyltransferase 1-domain-containing protein [Phyllosticta citribraziliensis]|uniref:Cryptococcal mannosyltransferase 1-domain-containing protein n=1 Tax=Phyllosticta citribraziliensis TaxID=989973 RepID=A0ABR1LJA9_9PEZI
MLLPRRYARLSRLPRTLFFDILPLFLVVYSVIEVLSIRGNLDAADIAAKASAIVTPKGEKIFISSIHLHDEQLLRWHWNKALLALVESLGPENVHVSIYESHSLDNTKGALRELADDLEKIGARRSIELDETTRAQTVMGNSEEPGWIMTSRGEKELRRIPYLSKLRNKTLKPLVDLEKQGERFDKVIFLNDVVFKAEDVINLLATNGGKYAAACALDFKVAPLFYDTFALRDADGHEPISISFPYFRSATSRRAFTSGNPVVPVSSCWNGIVAMDAVPFYTALNPLRFRGFEDGLAKEHVEGSECCLIHADNPYSSAHGVFVNTAVRVAYNKEAYEAVNPTDGPWVSSWDIFKGMWKNRTLRLLKLGGDRKEMAVRARIKHWEKINDRDEPGDYCAIDEMQVLRLDGWAHV